MPRTPWRIRLAAALVLAAVGFFAPRPAAADPEACREWRAEHTRWRTEAVRRFLLGAPQSSQDEAVFELLQREAYLTSCPVSVGDGRERLVGWRLVDRAPDEYATAVVESVLAQGGFDLTLSTTRAALRAPASPARRPSTRSRRNAVSRLRPVAP